jgi:predicted small lipoprotein YifL
LINAPDGAFTRIRVHIATDFDKDEIGRKSQGKVKAQMLRSVMIPAAAMAVFAMLLAGCGRKGNFEAPKPAAAENPAPDAAKPSVKDRPFLLDPLL